MVTSLPFYIERSVVINWFWSGKRNQSLSWSSEKCASTWSKQIMLVALWSTLMSDLANSHHSRAK